MQIRVTEQSYLKTEWTDSLLCKRVVYPPLGFCHMNGLSHAPLSTLSAMKGQFIPRSLKGVNSTHLDLLRLASAAAAWSSWVDLLTGTPNTALWVTSLRMRLWPLLGAIFGDEGGVNEPTLWITLPAVFTRKKQRELWGETRELQFQFSGYKINKARKINWKREFARDDGL